MLAAQLGTCASSREQITSDLCGSSRRRFTFEVVFPLVGLTWKTNMGNQRYKGPLLISCYCGRNHSPLIGITDTDEFQTSTSVALRPKFWDLCCL